MSRLLVTSHNPRFYHGIALPVPPLVLVIGLQRGKTQRQCPTLTIRAQAHIHAEHEAVGGDLVQSLNQPLAQADKKLLVVDGTAPATGFSLPREREDEINIRRDVKLVPSQFPHTQNNQGLRAFLTRRRIYSPRRSRLLASVFVQPIQGPLDTGIGEITCGRHGFGEIGPPHQIPPDNPELYFRPESPQRRLKTTLINHF